VGTCAKGCFQGGPRACTGRTQRQAREAPRQEARQAGAQDLSLPPPPLLPRRLQARQKGGRPGSQALCAQYFMSETAMEAVLAGRADYAATLADLGFAPPAFVDGLRGAARGQVGGAGRRAEAGQAEKGGWACRALCSGSWAGRVKPPRWLTHLLALWGGGGGKGAARGRLGPGPLVTARL
jgi:hypothetical protein